MREVLEGYRINDEEFEVEVKITGGKGRIKLYELAQQNIPPATSALLDKVKQDLIGQVRMGTEELLDPRILASVKSRFKEKTKLLLEQKLPALSPKKRNYLMMSLMKEMLGLGDLEILLNDENLEEIVVTSANEPIRVFHKKHGWLATNIFLRDELQIRDYFNTIARRVGRQITTLNPLLLPSPQGLAVLY